MIEFVTGDFFNYDADIRVNTVNCVGVMGAGVALMFKNRFPDMFKDYYKACKEGKVKPGNPYVWEDINLFSSLIIINFPTKVHWRNPSKYEYIEKGLVWLRNFLLDKKKSIVTLPALGCGHGGLEWEKVKHMINSYLGDLDTKILVFEPGSSTQKNKIEDDSKMKDNGISCLLPSDAMYPAKLRGTSALEIYCIGNKKLLDNKSISIVVDSKAEEREKRALSKFIDELPKDKFVFLLGLNNSNETDLLKEVLSKGFKVMIIIPYGILELKLRQDLDFVWNHENILILSTVIPSQPWNRYNSINSLKFRLNISDINIINCADIGYINKYKSYIKSATGNLFYINYWENDIESFNELRAKKIGLNSKTKRPNVLPLIKLIENL